MVPGDELYKKVNFITVNGWFRRNHRMVPGDELYKEVNFIAVNGWFRRNHGMAPGDELYKQVNFIAVNGWFRRYHWMVAPCSQIWASFHTLGSNPSPTESVSKEWFLTLYNRE